ncbi:hypothetical protein [Photobacterium satsumensis]|uniref:hypothetical protein n=1 Tax=Photobacterium satsumensis TaxID=2910239 RepID=UPI003D1260B3
MNRQRGLVTLLVTTMILVVSLVFSLASYKNVFYQIKRTQNEVLARKAHWLAEGAIECAFAEIKVSGFLPNNPLYPNACEASIAGTTINFHFSSVENFSIASSASLASMAKASLTKSAEVMSKSKSGAIQTGSSMFSNSSMNIYAPDPGVLAEDGWECIALRYRNAFVPNAAITNSGLSDKPNSQDCTISHKTNGVGIAALKSDFIHDPNLSPFENFFGVSDVKHDDVKNNKFDVVITEVPSSPGHLEYSGITECGKAIKEALSSGYESVWVEGNCEVSGDIYTDIVKLSNNMDGIIVLVHDGMFSVFPKAVPNNLKFQGMIFHYNYEYAFNFDDWKTSQAYSHLTHIPSVFGDNVNLASFYLHGALNLDGGLLLDAKHYDNTSKKYISQNALLNDSFGMTYNSSYFNKFSSSSNEIGWTEGSWHDF